MHHEVLAVGAGIGGGFLDTSELKPMKYKEAMSTKDKEQWIKAVDDKYNWMVSQSVWKAVNKKDVPSTAKILTTT